MMLRLHPLVANTLRIVVAGACCCGVWGSLSLARADYLFKKDTENSVRAAIHLAPDSGQYYMRLSQCDRAHAPELLATSLRLNRYNSEANIELGLRYEADGDYADAEKELLEAYDVDHTYLPRWSLANYYFRHDNMPAFWEWARSAASMPLGTLGPLFELCWRVSPDPKTITQAILNDNPEMLRQYIDFLLGKDQPAEVAAVAPHLVRIGDSKSNLAPLLSAVNRLLAVDDPAAASGLWRLLIAQGWVVGDSTLPNNGGFLREPVPVSFDWSLQEYDGLHSWPGPSGLQTEFAGNEPEDCIVAEQVVVLTPGTYALSYGYRTSDIPPSTGIKWQILDANSGKALAESPDLSSDATTYSGVGFTVPPGVSALRLRLVYRRTLGTPHISGMLDVLSTQIRPLP
jgi:tetratricopeptide (TPR) repeat protein